MQFLVALIGLGVSLDFSLLLVMRWREELATAAGRHFGGNRCVPTGCGHVRERQQVGYQIGVGVLVERDQGAISLRNADDLGLTTVETTTVLAQRLQTDLTDRAGVVAVEEATHHELPRFHGADSRADSLDDANVLVPDWGWFGHLCGAAIAPEVRPAHARRHGANDRVTGLLDGRAGRSSKRTSPVP